jgi:hypothetical protein
MHGSPAYVCTTHAVARLKQAGQWEPKQPTRKKHVPVINKK